MKMTMNKYNSAALLILSLLSLLVFSKAILAKANIEFSKTIVLDADTANEVDDIYAIAAALIVPDWNITALNATQWQTSHWTSPTAMEDSHRLNQVIVGYIGSNTPTKRGGVARMYDWGDQAQHSAAAYNIIQEAKQMPEGQKLTVIALGALTNVASAIFIDPSIESKIDLYWLGSSYDFEKGVMKTTDFNAIMDPQALHILLDSSVDMTIIPVNVAVDMQFNYDDTFKALKGKSHFTDFVVDSWYKHMDGSRKSRAIWDLALIYAMSNPEWAETTDITTSKDLGNRPITYISKIDGKKMYEAFIKRILAHVDAKN